MAPFTARIGAPLGCRCPAPFAGTSYQLRVKLRKRTLKRGFSFLVPVADRMVQFIFDGGYAEGRLIGLQEVDGNALAQHPGVVRGHQVND